MILFSSVVSVFPVVRPDLNVSLLSTMQGSWSWRPDTCCAPGSSIHARFPVNKHKGWEPYWPSTSFTPIPKNRPCGYLVLSLLWPQHDWQAETELAGGLSGHQLGHSFLLRPPCNGVSPSHRGVQPARRNPAFVWAGRQHADHLTDRPEPQHAVHLQQRHAAHFHRWRTP